MIEIVLFVNIIEILCLLVRFIISVKDGTKMEVGCSGRDILYP